MAKKAVSDVPEAPVKKKSIRYYAKFLGYGFDVPVVDENGEPRYKKNNQGGFIEDSEGNRIPLYKSLRFQTLVNRMNKGYLSFFNYDPNDTSAQNAVIGKRLQELHNDRFVPNVMNGDKYDSETNNAMFLERKRAEALEDEVSRLRAENERLQTPEELQRRLDELTKG
jgi:hypothetical protein